MIAIKKKYVTDDRNRKVAVQIGIEEYNKIEELLENYGLYRLMTDDSDEKNLSLEEAKVYYRKLKKKK